MTWWQIACGTGGRNYAHLFTDHDQMFLGPGNPGPYDSEVYAREIKAGRITAYKAGLIRAFREDVIPGDTVILRKGHEVIALGIVADEEYRWDAAFDDVRGWDLQHSRRVIWQHHLSEQLEDLQAEQKLFGKRIDVPMFTRVMDKAVLEPLEGFVDHFSPRSLRAPSPQPSAVLDDFELSKELFSRGLSNDSTEAVVSALNRQRRLLQWYYHHGKDSKRPKESEVVAHMVLPLMLALGWSEQLLAVEWQKVDLAGFRSAPTVASACSLVCEAKGLGRGLGNDFEQARRYVDRLSLDKCRRILLTEGARYYLYSKSGKNWPEEPTGYFNVEKMRVRNADGTDAIETLLEVGRTG